MQVDRRPFIAVGSLGLLIGVPAALVLAGVVDGRVLSLIRNTLLLSAETCAIGVPLGTWLAFVLYRTDVPGRTCAAMVMAGMLFVPLYLQAAGWDAGFRQLGWLTSAGDPLVQPLLDGWWAAVWIHAMAAVPWVVLIVGLGLRWVPPELEEAALLDATPWQVFRRVTRSRAALSAGVAALWVVVMTAGEMTVTDRYQVRTYAEELYVSLQFDVSEAQRGVAGGLAAMIWLTLVAMLAVAAVAPSDEVGTARRPHVFRLGRWRIAATAAAWLAVAWIVAVPLVNLCFKAGMLVDVVDQKAVYGWSPAKALHTVATTPARFRNDFLWTIGIGAVAASCAGAIAAPLAWWARGGRWRSLPALLAAAIGAGLPGPMLGLGIIRLLDRDQATFRWLYDRTILAPVLAMTLRALPITILVWWYSLRSIGRDQLESAATEGAGMWSRFLRVAAPQRIAALATAWLIGLAIATGDLAASILVVPPGVDLVSVRVFTLLHYGVDEQVAGLCLVMMLGYGCVAAAVLTLIRVARREFRRGTADKLR